MIVGLTYGAPALAAAARGNRVVWQLHRAALARRVVPVVSSLVVSHVTTHLGSAVVGQILDAYQVVKMTADEAYIAGRVLGASGSNRLADAAVIARSVRHGEAVLTLQADDLRGLAESIGYRCPSLIVASSWETATRSRSFL